MNYHEPVERQITAWTADTRRFCSSCEGNASFRVLIRFTTRNRRGKRVPVQHVRAYCCFHAKKYAECFGLKMPEPITAKEERTS